MNFEELVTTRKGTVGEAEVDKYLKSKGIIPYSPASGVAHPFDRLCATVDKKKIFIAECKAKASRTYYPDTGINLKSYNEYKYILDTYGIDIWLFFVDEYKRKIYGNLLTELSKEIVIKHGSKAIKYPLVQKSTYGTEIIYFPLHSMKPVCDISEKAVAELKRLSSRNYEYPTEVMT